MAFACNCRAASMKTVGEFAFAVLVIRVREDYAEAVEVWRLEDESMKGYIQGCS